MKQASATKSVLSTSALCLLICVLQACQSLSIPGKKSNLFEGANAQEAAEKIRQKMGVDAVKISRMEIREDKLEMVVQDPNKPKNLDSYTFSDGAVTGPKPVETLVLGEQEFTADKMRLFNLNDVNLAATSEVCRKAVERAGVEDGNVELISINWESASITRSKEERERAKAEEDRLDQEAMKGKIDPLERIRRRGGDLAVTWRIWVKSPRMTKDFYADAKGNLVDDPFGLKGK